MMYDLHDVMLNNNNYIRVHKMPTFKAIGHSELIWIYLYVCNI